MKKLLRRIAIILAIGSISTLVNPAFIVGVVIAGLGGNTYNYPAQTSNMNEIIQEWTDSEREAFSHVQFQTIATIGKNSDGNSTYDFRSDTQKDDLTWFKGYHLNQYEPLKYIALVNMWGNTSIDYSLPTITFEFFADGMDLGGNDLPLFAHANNFTDTDPYDDEDWVLNYICVQYVSDGTLFWCDENNMYTRLTDSQEQFNFSEVPVVFRSWSDPFCRWQRYWSNLQANIKTIRIGIILGPIFIVVSLLTSAWCVRRRCSKQCWKTDHKGVAGKKTSSAFAIPPPPPPTGDAGA
eukprot:TRINITY_DN11455_c0_g1_i1.p1 TRINITY_DN11455_c0_g1~~TRINITY_DN11455_c0_g1_i1.p1  ORF type:complete len:295 (-),score=32.85 TRINITY_DN11455_c0_g1_i1:106-990(-)